MCFPQVCKRTTPAIQTFLCIDISNPTAFQLTQPYSKNSNSLASPEKHQPSPLSSTLCQVSVTWAKAGSEHWAQQLPRGCRAPHPGRYPQPAMPCDCKCIHPAAQTQPREATGCQGSGEALSRPCQQAQGPRKGSSQGQEQHTRSWVAACWAAPFDREVTSLAQMIFH